jgi:hypothetical protein
MTADWRRRACRSYGLAKHRRIASFVMPYSAGAPDFNGVSSDYAALSGQQADAKAKRAALAAALYRRGGLRVRDQQMAQTASKGAETAVVLMGKAEVR